MRATDLDSVIQRLRNDADACEGVTDRVTYHGTEKDQLAADIRSVLAALASESARVDWLGLQNFREQKAFTTTPTEGRDMLVFDSQGMSQFVSAPTFRELCDVGMEVAP